MEVKGIKMLETGFLAGLVAKLAALGTAAKVAVATTTAALTVTAAAAGGILAGGAGGSGPDATLGAAAQSSVAQTAAVADSAIPTTSGESAVQAGGDASVSTGAGSTPTTARAGAGVGAAAPAASLTPSLPVPVPGLPDLSTLTQLPTQVMGCLAPVLNMVSSLPAVSPQQISQIGPNIVGCVTGIVKGLPLPFGLNACISQILGFVSDMASQLPSGGVPDVGGFNVASCIPSGLPVPTGSSGGSPFSGGGFSFGR